MLADLPLEQSLVVAGTAQPSRVVGRHGLIGMVGRRRRMAGFAGDALGHERVGDRVVAGGVAGQALFWLAAAAQSARYASDSAALPCEPSAQALCVSPWHAWQVQLTGRSRRGGRLCGGDRGGQQHERNGEGQADQAPHGTSASSGSSSCSSRSQSHRRAEKHVATQAALGKQTGQFAEHLPAGHLRSSVGRAARPRPAGSPSSPSNGSQPAPRRSPGGSGGRARPATCQRRSRPRRPQAARPVSSRGKPNRTPRPRTTASRAFRSRSPSISLTFWQFDGHRSRSRPPAIRRRAGRS